MLIEPFALNGPTGNTWTKVPFNTRFVIGISYLRDFQQIEGIYIHIVEPYPAMCRHRESNEHLAVPRGGDASIIKTALESNESRGLIRGNSLETVPRRRKFQSGLSATTNRSVLTRRKLAYQPLNPGVLKRKKEKSEDEEEEDVLYAYEGTLKPEAPRKT